MIGRRYIVNSRYCIISDIGIEAPFIVKEW